MLNDKELKKYEIIKKVVGGSITRKEASAELHISLRQVDRLKLKYLSDGEESFIHKSRGKESANKIDHDIIIEIENKYLNEYYDYNFQHFYEEVVKPYNISYSTILRCFNEDDIISPLARKKTVNAYNEKMNEISKNIEEENFNEKIELFKSRIIEVENAHARRTVNIFSFGEEVQMDACMEMWFGNILSFLHLAIDKATKKVLFGWFEFEEITRGYYVLLFNIIINYGIPKMIKADNRSSFSANNAKDKAKKLFLTQFGKVCEELNITLYTTSNPKGKANIERENGVFKNRLMAELRHEGIDDIDKANDYLNQVFIPKMNERFSYKINSKKISMQENIYTEEELKLIISEKYKRIIDNASCISYKSKYYIPVNIETREVTDFMKGTECIFIINYDGEYYGKIENHYYKLEVIENRDSILKKESNADPLKKEHHKYIPPANHPWRKNMMLK